MIAGDLFWKYTNDQIKNFFDKFLKKQINIHIVYGNHTKLNWFKHKIIKSQGYMKEIKIDKQSITICHYPLIVYNRSHHNSWNLYGHIHKGDSTWNRMKTISNINQILGKSLNINIELHDFKPWTWEEVKEEIKNKPDNWDLIKK